MLACQCSDLLFAVFDFCHFPAEGVTLGDDIGERRPVFALQTLEQRKPILDLLQPGGRGFDRVGIAAQEQGEIFELRLDAIASLEVGVELRVERGQFGHPPPDASQIREHRSVALV
jgi:hypothetical protein